MSQGLSPHDLCPFGGDVGTEKDLSFPSDRPESPKEYLPSQGRLRYETKKYVDPLAVEIVLPFAHFPVLKVHIHGEEIKQDSNGHIDSYHEVGYTAFGRNE